MWFAFKLYLWRIEKQHGFGFRRLSQGCDLLSNCIFDVLKNNLDGATIERLTVVICFQIVSLTYWKTTGYLWYHLIWQLWFAFKLYLWRIEKQPLYITSKLLTCCDLLSNCIFDVLKNNILLRKSDDACVVICFQIVSLTYWKTTQVPRYLSDRSVVICFQIVSLTYWKTTWQSKYPLTSKLWFAFKLYLWRIEKQHWQSQSPILHCCDLLSNCIFDVLKNNRVWWYSEETLVVICFQIVSLTYWKTTFKASDKFFEKLWFAFKLYLWRIEKQRTAMLWRSWTLLWFAFKLYLWRIEKQPVNYKTCRFVGCDLLSNCIFDVLKNNLYWCASFDAIVVICFQIVSLTYWKTTYERTPSHT